MKPIRTLLSIATVTTMALLSACASPGYDAYTKAQVAIEQAKNAAEVARYTALGQAVKSGDAVVSVAAVIGLAMAQQGSQQASTLQAPQADPALQWASILIPGLTQMYGIARNADVAINSSNNAMATSVNTTGAFVGIAGKIQAPGAITTLSGTGTMGGGTYSTTDNHSVVTPTPTVITPVVQVVPTVINPVIVNPPTIITPIVNSTTGVTIGP